MKITYGLCESAMHVHEPFGYWTLFEAKSYIKTHLEFVVSWFPFAWRSQNLKINAQNRYEQNANAIHVIKQAAMCLLINEPPHTIDKKHKRSIYSSFALSNDFKSTLLNLLKAATCNAAITALLLFFHRASFSLYSSSYFVLHIFHYAFKFVFFLLQNVLFSEIRPVKLIYNKISIEIFLEIVYICKKDLMRKTF